MKIKEFIPLYASTNSSLPAYRRIKEMLTEQINQGNLTAGAQVPSENELVDALGISRMTVNRAMRELTTEGILTRTRGVGTFVAEPKAPGALLEVRNIADEIQQRGHTHSSRVLALRQSTDSDDLNPPSELGKSAFYSLLLHYENDVPFQLEERFVSTTLAPDYLTQDFTRITPNDYLCRAAPLAHGKHRVEAVLASQDQYRLLGIEAGLPCLRVERWTYSVDGLVSVARLLHPGSRIRLEGEFSV